MKRCRCLLVVTTFSIVFLTAATCAALGTAAGAGSGRSHPSGIRDYTYPLPAFSG
ncbi:MAG: hypothetical protein QNK29_08385 [Desulfobacterales bacterium]|nr:hypothetical protein [Desulfobacterales bacterium]